MSPASFFPNSVAKSVSLIETISLPRRMYSFNTEISKMSIIIVDEMFFVDLSVEGCFREL